MLLFCLVFDRLSANDFLPLLTVAFFRDSLKIRSGYHRFLLNFTIGLFKMSVAPGAFGKPGGPFHGFFFQRLPAMFKFIGHGLLERQVKLFDGRHTISAHTCLGKGRQPAGKL
jgi:hypothetical protein